MGFLKIEIKISVPSEEFPDDILLDFSSFCYFVFEDSLEIFTRENYPHAHLGICDLKIDTNRRQMFKTYSEYNKATRRMIDFHNNNAY